MPELREQVKEVLRCTVERITKGEWCTGSTHRYSRTPRNPGMTTKHCLVGLVSRCITGADPDVAYIDYPTTITDPEKRLVARATIEALYAQLPDDRRAQIREAKRVRNDDDVEITTREMALVNFNDSVRDDSRQARQHRHEVQAMVEQALVSL